MPGSTRFVAEKAPLTGAEPRGCETLVHGLPTYLVEPSDSTTPIKAIVVVIPDALGWRSTNTRAVADNVADKGSYRVILPDFTHGATTWMVDAMRTVMKPGYDILSTANAAFLSIFGVAQSQQAKQTHQTVLTFFSELRTSGEVLRGLPVFAAGFSWGGEQVVLLAGGHENGGRPLIDAGFAAHSSSGDLLQEVERMRAPVSFAIPAAADGWSRGGAEATSLEPSTADRLEWILRQKAPADRGEVRKYERQLADAEDQAIAWFDARVPVRV